MEKMTNAKALSYVLKNVELPTDVTEKLEKMLEQVQKKNGAERKPTANQTENVGFKNDILEGMVENRMYTITDLIKSIPAISDLSNQRVSAMVRQLVETGLLERTEDKRKAYFSLAK